MPTYRSGDVTIHHDEALKALARIPTSSVDAIVTDPPYGLEFMGKDWDSPWKRGDDINADAGMSGTGYTDGGKRLPRPSFTGSTNPKCRTCGGTRRGRRDGTAKVAVCLCADGGHFPNVRAAEMRAFQDWCEQWAQECLRVLKPGGHLLAFGGTRTWHRLACAVEDAGFEMRDSIAWLQGAGFPKSRNVSRDLDGKRCTCSVKSSHGSSEGQQGVERRGVDDSVHAVRNASEAIPESGEAAGSSVLRVQLPVESARSGFDGGQVRRDGSEARTALWSGEPGMEGRGDAQAAEGELQGSAVRPLSSGVVDNGDAERLHSGASAGHGAVGGPSADAAGDGQSHRSGPVEQRPIELGVVPDERGSQARGVRAVCERCAKPVVPNGLGTALKPAFEPVVVARKPLVGTVAANVLTHGTGALNIDATRIGAAEGDYAHPGNNLGHRDDETDWRFQKRQVEPHALGRWPANVVLDEDQAAALDQQSGAETSRFFYCAKAPKRERPVVDGVAHPTVKPLALMRWLVRLVTPPGGLVLDPFAGSGTTVEAAMLEGFRVTAIERGGPEGTSEAKYLAMIEQRVRRARATLAAQADLLQAD